MKDDAMFTIEPVHIVPTRAWRDCRSVRMSSTAPSSAVLLADPHFSLLQTKHMPLGCSVLNMAHIICASLAVGP
eukprot:1159670-Pelagomonas_calceolata.AAC.5